MANAANQANENAAEIEPYKLSEIFSLVPEYDGDQISLNTFINACNRAHQMCTNDQQILLVIKIKNQLRGRAAQLINSRDINTWNDISQLLTVHFGDPRDLTSLIQDLQRMSQLSNENPLTFAARLQTHNSKMYSAVAKQILTQEQKNAQLILIDNMCLNTLLTGLEPKLGQVIRAGHPVNMLEAITRIKRELQLSYFENQKFQRSNKAQPIQKPQNSNPNLNQKFCSFCKRNGHTINECKTRMSQFQNQRQSFSQNNQNFQPRPQSFQSQNFQQRPSNFQPNQQNSTFVRNNHIPQNKAESAQPQNFQRPQNFQQRPNPNFNRFNQKTHHVNLQQNEYDYSNHEFDNTTDFDNQTAYFDYSANQNFENNYSDEYCPNNEHYNTSSDEQYFSQCNENFPIEASEISQLTTQIQTINIQDNFNPNLNFSEQHFV